MESAILQTGQNKIKVTMPNPCLHNPPSSAPPFCLPLAGRGSLLRKEWRLSGTLEGHSGGALQIHQVQGDGSFRSDLPVGQGRLQQRGSFPLWHQAPQVVQQCCSHQKLPQSRSIR